MKEKTGKRINYLNTPIGWVENRFVNDEKTLRISHNKISQKNNTETGNWKETVK